MTTDLDKVWRNKNGTEMLRRRRNLVEVSPQLFNADSLEELGNACLEAAFEMKYGETAKSVEVRIAGA